MYPLQLERPIVFFDLETTGLDKQECRIVEITLMKFSPEGHTEGITRRINPQMKISKESTDVHGITDQDVFECPTFGQLAHEFLAFISGCDLGGFNCNSFDAPVLYYHFFRAGLNWNYQKHHIVDAGNLFKIKEPRTLTAAVKLYLGEDLVDAHSSAADTTKTAQVLQVQLSQYADVPKTVPELALFSNYGRKILDLSGKFHYNDKNEICFSFGKHKDCRAIDEPGFLQWMRGKDFAPDTMAVVDKLLKDSYW